MTVKISLTHRDRLTHREATKVDRVGQTEGLTKTKAANNAARPVRASSRLHRMGNRVDSRLAMQTRLLPCLPTSAGVRVSQETASHTPLTVSPKTQATKSANQIRTASHNCAEMARSLAILD